MINNDIYNMILDESNMKNLLKLSLLNKYNQYIIEKYCKKLFIMEMYQSKSIRFTSHILKNRTCHICHNIYINSNGIVLKDNINICNICLLLPKCDECGEMDPNKIRIRRRSVYCKDQELCEIGCKQIDEYGFQNDILQNL